MVGFEETLTDPSYYGQIITQTYPLIGNYGMNQRGRGERPSVWAQGYIVREACTTPPATSAARKTLDESFLKQNGVIGIEGIDTRQPDPHPAGERRHERRHHHRVRSRRRRPRSWPPSWPQIQPYAVAGRGGETVTCRQATDLRAHRPGLA